MSSGRTFIVLVVALILFAGCVERPDAPDDPIGDPDESPYDPGWPDLDAAVVRPGVKLFDDLEGQSTKAQRLHCSSNFVFSGPDNKSLYLGTASHCVAGFDLGKVLPLANGRAAGELVYCSFGTLTDSPECPTLTLPDGSPHPNDFALIRIHDEYRNLVHPAVLAIGGPVALPVAAPERGAILYTYGNSDYRDLRLLSEPPIPDARAGRVWGHDDWTVHAHFDSTNLPGDSGGVVVGGDGSALGVIMAFLTVDGCPGPRPDMNYVVYLPAAMGFLHDHTDLQIELKTWPLLDPPKAQDLPDWPCHEDVPAHSEPAADDAAVRGRHTET